MHTLFLKKKKQTKQTLNLQPIQSSHYSWSYLDEKRFKEPRFQYFANLSDSHQMMDLWLLRVQDEASKSIQYRWSRTWCASLLPSVLSAVFQSYASVSLRQYFHLQTHMEPHKGNSSLAPGTSTSVRNSLPVDHTSLAMNSLQCFC